VGPEDVKFEGWLALLSGAAATMWAHAGMIFGMKGRLTQAEQEIDDIKKRFDSIERTLQVNADKAEKRHEKMDEKLDRLIERSIAR